MKEWREELGGGARLRGGGIDSLFGVAVRGIVERGCRECTLSILLLTR